MQRVISRVHQIVTTHSVPGEAPEDPSPRPPAIALPSTPVSAPAAAHVQSPSSVTQREISLAVERLQFATLLGERKKAISSLRELARSFLHTDEDDTGDYRRKGTPDHAALGSATIPVVLHALGSDPRDTELMEAMLELLQELVAASPSTALALLRTPPKPASTQSSLRAAMTPTASVSGTQICLQMLQDPSPWIRGPTITLVKLLQEAQQSEFAASVLECKEGLRRLLEVVEDKREHIRDAALQVLVKMTEREKNVQQFLAFEDGFVRLFAIMEVEGLVEGSSVVSDCLQIVTNMLRDNLMNQTLFRDLPFLATHIPQLLTLPSTAHHRDEDEEVTPTATKSSQKKRTMKLVLQLVRFLVAPLYEGAREESLDEMAQRDRSRKQQELGRIQSAITRLTDLLGAIAEIICCGNEDLADLQLQALDLIQLLSQGNGGNQIILVNLLTSPSQLSLLSELVKLDISHDETPVAAAATNLLDVLFSKNESAKMAIFQHLHAPPPINDDDDVNGGQAVTPPLPAGRVLLDSLIFNAEEIIERSKPSRKSTILAWKSCHRFAFLIADSSYCKELALRVPRQYDNPEAQAVAGDLFLSRCLRLVGSSNTVPASLAQFQVQVAVLTMLIQWCTGCPNAVREIVGSVTNLSTLVDVFAPADPPASGDQSSERVQLEGLVALLLGCCLEFLTLPATDTTAAAVSPPPSITRQKLLDLISRKIGLERFTTALVQLQQTPQFLSCGRAVNSRHTQRARMLLPDQALLASDDKEDGDVGYLFPLYDRAFTAQCRELADKIQARVLSIFTGAGGEEDHAMAGGGAVPSAASAYQDLIRMQDKQIHELERELQQLKQQQQVQGSETTTISAAVASEHELELTKLHASEQREWKSKLAAAAGDFKALESRFHGVSKALALLEAEHASCQRGSVAPPSSTAAIGQVMADLEHETQVRRRLEEELRNERHSRTEAEQRMGKGTHTWETSSLLLNQQLEDLRVRLAEKDEQLKENSEMLDVFRQGQESAKRSATVLKQELNEAREEIHRLRSGLSPSVPSDSPASMAKSEAAAKELYELWEKERVKVRTLKAELEKALAQSTSASASNEAAAEGRIVALQEEIQTLHKALEQQQHESSDVNQRLQDTVASQLEEITQLRALFAKIETAASDAANHIAAKDEALLEMAQRLNDVEAQAKEQRRKSKKTIGELEDEIARMFFEKTEAHRKSKASLKEAENELARVFLEKVELEKQLDELSRSNGHKASSPLSSSSASSSFSVGDPGPAQDPDQTAALEDMLILLASMEIQCSVFRESLEQAKGTDAVRAAVELSRKRGALPL